MARVKGIHPLERHAEKIVLGLVLLVVVVALAFQFLPGRSDIEVGPNQRVAPQDAFTAIAEDARRLQARLQDPAPPTPEVPRVALAESFRNAIERPAIDGVPLAAVAWGESPRISVDGAGPIADTLPRFTPPAPAIAAAYSHWITVDPFFLAEHPDLAEVLPGEQPYDLAGVTASAVFDGVALEQTLRGGADGVRGVPPQWWRNNIAVLGVQAERQRLRADGSWSEPEPVATALPTAFDPLASQPQPTPEQMPLIVEAATQRASAVLSPAYLPQISGLPWLPPREWEARAARMQRIGEARQIERRIADLQAQIERLERRTDTAGGGSRSGPGGQAPGAGGAGAGGRSGGGRPGGGGQTSGQDDRGNEQRQRQLEQYRNQLEAAQARLRELGLEDGAAAFLDPARQWAAPEEEAEAGDSGSGAPRPPRGPEAPGLGSNPGRAGSGGGAGPAAGAGEPVNLLGNPRVPLWVHDAGVEPGATYRYRLRVVLNNPYFGRSQSLGQEPEQQELANAPTVASDWSEWGEPVQVGARRYFFVTGGSDGEGGVGRNVPWASTELYEMYYGFYRRGSARIEAGEPASDRVTLPPTLVLIDPDQASRESYADLLARWRQVAAPATGGRAPGAGAGGAGGATPTGRPGGGGTDGAGANEGRGNQAEPVRLEDVALPAGIRRVESAREVGGDIVLLDVAAVPVAGRNQLGLEAAPEHQIVFMDGSGNVLVRTPASDASSPQREIASLLAELGELNILLGSAGGVGQGGGAGQSGGAPAPTPGRNRAP